MIHLDFSDADNSSAEALTKSLGQMLDDIAELYAVSIPKRLTPKAKLKKLVTRLAEQNSVVILIDEYDKPN